LRAWRPATHGDSKRNADVLVDIPTRTEHREIGIEHDKLALFARDDEVIQQEEFAKHAPAIEAPRWY
jgi:hypothetical protein